MRFFLSLTLFRLVPRAAQRAILRACGSSERGWRKWRHFSLIDTLSRRQRQPSVLFRRRGRRRRRRRSGGLLRCNPLLHSAILFTASRSPCVCEWVSVTSPRFKQSRETSAALLPARQRHGADAAKWKFAQRQRAACCDTLFSATAAAVEKVLAWFISLPGLLYFHCICATWE